MFATLGVTLGCVLAFGMARYCGRSFVERRYGDKAAAFNRYAVQRPFILAILTRLFPSGNNLVFSLLAGVSRIAGMAFFSGVVPWVYPSKSAVCHDRKRDARR